jgi:hypothetical protein
MNNDIYPNNSKTNRQRCYLAIVLISFVMTGCASHNAASTVKDTEQSSNKTTISVEEIKQYLDKQQKWLSGLHEGMPPEDALRQVVSYMQYSLQYQENGRFFLYMQGQYPKTGLMFGLFFEDGKLTRLLLDQAVYDFYWCRYNYARVRGHLFQYWLPGGFKKTASWIEQEDRLGDEYDDVSTGYRQAVNNNGAGTEAIEVATHLPLAAFALPLYLVALPFLPENEIVGEPGETAKSRNKRLIEAAGKIKLGVTTDIELMQLLGIPDNKGDTRWTYRNHILMEFGIIDGIVSWIESWTKATPLKMSNTVTHNNKVRCEPSN